MPERKKTALPFRVSAFSPSETRINPTPARANAVTQNMFSPFKVFD